MITLLDNLVRRLNRASVFVMFWLAVCAFGCSRAVAATTIVASVFPLADVVAQIGGDAVDVHTLLPAGANPHTFEPTPEQLQTIASAGVIVRVGAGLDDWLDRLLKTTDSHARVVAITEGVALLGPADSSHGDPHVWLDPILVRDSLVPGIRAALIGADPAHESQFQAGAARFSGELTQLDREINTMLQPLPERGFVAVHPAWRYFARRYRLEEVAAVEESPGKEPSAQSIAGVIERARARHVRAVLTEPQINDRMAKVIAAEIGATTFVVDPLGGPRVAGRDGYLALMRYNSSVFAQALR